MILSIDLTQAVEDRGKEREHPSRFVQKLP
jgi:hypothetical protein